jgi:hypothetical protein
MANCANMKNVNLVLRLIILFYFWHKSKETFNCRKRRVQIQSTPEGGTRPGPDQDLVLRLIMIPLLNILPHKIAKDHSVYIE